jgi:periplasmic divalent cation tolerance protein
MADEHLLVMCTCPGSTVAAEIATALIEQELAACVTQVPGVKSWYRWEGRLEHQEEVLLLIKTTRQRYGALEAAIVGLHPYDIPEVIALPLCAGSAAYLKWVSDCTRA